MSERPFSTADSAAVDWASVAPSDTDDLPGGPPKALHIVTAGDVRLVSFDGSEVTMSLAAGYHPLRPRQIKSTGTTATGITALY